MINPSAELAVTGVIEATRGKLIRGDLQKAKAFKGVGTDSRMISPGGLFVALHGERFDGHDYLDQALEKGAGGLLVHRDDGRDRSAVPTILVDDTLVALGDIARDWRNSFPVTVIAVTGSSGKTTTKEMIAGILGQRKNVLKTQGNFNNLIGLPLTILGLNAEHEIAVLELGTNRPGEIARLTEIAGPDIAIITNVGPAHLEGFGSMEGVWREKSDLFRSMPEGGTAVINVDDEYVRLSDSSRAKKIVTFGFGPEAEISASDVLYDGARGASFSLTIDGIKSNVIMHVSGRHNIYNALAAAASAWAAGSPRNEIIQGLANFRPISGRTEIIPLKNGAFVINDVYNANPASVREALRTLQTLRGSGKGVAVLGDMLELGREAEARHRDIGGLLADTGIEYAYLRGRLSQATAAGAIDRGMMVGQIIRFDDPAEIVDSLIARIGPGDWILVKGSRQMKMEEVVECLIRGVGRADAHPIREKEEQA
ncbi:MAG: UDP-N-acetylmuramoyl-tripeptide--D-alanyl-D-alanine ligase [Syntrophales bacterium]|nr:UDP-N-acetylmuramoyl-tripeptide--D-alanyl-D-alanine ligase [Syntrophales bacterium]